MLTKRKNLGAVVLILVALVLLWPHRPWRQTGESSTRSQYTGTFGGHCNPTDRTVCICNQGQSVCVDGESLANGLEPHVSLPAVGTLVVVKVKNVKRGGFTSPAAVSIEPAKTG